MSELSDKLDNFDAQIEALKEERANAIKEYPANFEELSIRRYMESHRYIVIYGDGHPVGSGSYYDQRPAAFRGTRQGRYVWDRRAGKIYNDHEKEIAKTERAEV